MKRTEKSVPEIEIEEANNEIGVMIAYGHMKVGDALKIQDLLCKLLQATARLRISRDNGTFRNKLLLEEIKELKEKIKTLEKTK